MGGDGKKTYVYSVKPLLEKYGVRQKDLKEHVRVEAKVKRTCRTCNQEYLVTSSVCSRTALQQLESGRWYVCPDCTLRAEERHDQQKIEYLEQAEQRAAENDAKELKKAHQRLNKKPAVMALYGERFLSECPACNNGFLVIKFNNRACSVFVSCTGGASKAGCNYVDKLDDMTLEQHDALIETFKARFLRAVSASWRIPQCCAAQSAPQAAADAFMEGDDLLMAQCMEDVVTA
jgi:hypothetical protein